MPELTDEQLDQIMGKPQQGKFEPATSDDGTLSDSALDNIFKASEEKPYDVKAHISKSELDPIANQFQLRFKTAKRDWRDNTMWFGAWAGLAKKDEVAQKYGSTASTKADDSAIEKFNDENEVYALRNILHPTYAAMDLVQSGPQMGLAITGSVYGGVAGAAVGGLLTAATGGAAAPAIPALAATGSFLGAYVPNTIQFTGALYKKYSEAGIDDLTAKRLALAGGLSQGLYETVGDLITKGVLTKRGAQLLFKSPQGKVLIKESVNAMLKEGGSLGLKAGVEGLTEAGENVSELAADSLAAQLSSDDYDPNLKPTWKDFYDNIGQGFIAGTRSGSAVNTTAKITGLTFRLGTKPANVAEAFNEINAEIEDGTKRIMQKREEETFRIQQEKKPLQGNVAVNVDPRDAVKNAEFAVEDINNLIDDYIANGEDIPQDVTDQLKQAKADLKLAKDNLQNERDEERLSKFNETLSKLEQQATEPNVDDEQRSKIVDKAVTVGKEVREIQASILKRKIDRLITANEKKLSEISSDVMKKAETRLAEIKQRVKTAQQELQELTQGAIKKLSDQMIPIQDEIQARLKDGRPTQQLIARYNRLKKEREKISRSINKHGNLTKVAPDNIKKLYNELIELKEERESIENETTPEFEKLQEQVDKLQEERAYLDMVLETIDLGAMTSEDFDSFKISIENRSAKRLANTAAKSVLQGYLQGKRDAGSLSKMRKAYSQLIRSSGLTKAEAAALPSADSVTFKNLAEKLDGLKERIAKITLARDLAEANAKLDKALSKSNVSGRDKSKVGFEAQQILDWFKALIRNENVKPAEGDENLLMAVKQRFDEVDFQNPESISTFAKFINDITQEGAAAWQNEQVQAKVRDNLIAAKVDEALDGTNPVSSEIGDPNALSSFQKWLKAFGVTWLDWDGNLSNLFQDTVKSVRDPIINLISVAKEVSNEQTMRHVWSSKLSDALKTATGLNDWQLFVKQVASNTNDKSKWLGFSYRGFNSITSDKAVDRANPTTKLMKPGDALQLWMYLQTPSLKNDLNSENDLTTREDMRSAGLNEEDSTEAALERALFDYDPDMLKMGRAMMSWYDSFFPVLAEEYKRAFGRELKKDQLYAGFVRREGTNENNIAEQYSNFIETLGRVTSQVNKHLKISSSTFERKENTGRAILPTNAFTNAYHKMNMDIHWVVWREKAATLSRIFFNPQRAAKIRAKFGDTMYRVVTQHLRDMTHGYIERDFAHSNLIGNTIGNLAIQKLGGWKPEQLTKQFTGIFLTALEVGPRKFFILLDEFINDPNFTSRIKEVQNTDWYKDRFSRGTENLQGGINAGDPVVQGFKDKLTDIFLWFMITGDKGNAVVIGDMMTKHYMEAGFTKEQAQEKAGEFVNRTQSTSRIDMLSQFQRDKRYKIFSTFMQQQGSMYQYQLLAMKEFLNKPSVESAKTLINTELTIRLANAAFQIAGTTTKAVLSGGLSDDDLDQAQWDIWLALTMPSFPTIINEILKPIIASTENLKRDLQGNKRKVDVFEFKPPVLGLVSKDSLHVIRDVKKMIESKSPTDTAVTGLDFVMILNRLSALTPVGFIPLDPTIKAVKKAIEGEK